MIKLIATDMDGTLLDEDKNLPEKFGELCRKLKELDIKFAISSGRSFSALEYIFDSPDIPSSDFLYICDNGANIIIPDTEPKYSAISSEEVSDIIDTCEKFGDVIPVLCCVGNIYYPEYAKAQFQSEINNFYIRFQTTKDLKEIKDPVIKIAVCDLKGAREHSYPVFAEKYGKNLTAVVSGLYWMDIMNKGINKGYGVSKIQEHFGILPSETMVFGDYFNDAPMFDYAYYSYVMENACDDMKKLGRFIAPSNINNGVVDTICKQLKIEL